MLEEVMMEHVNNLQDYPLAMKLEGNADDLEALKQQISVTIQNLQNLHQSLESVLLNRNDTQNAENLAGDHETGDMDGILQSIGIEKNEKTKTFYHFQNATKVYEEIEEMIDEFAQMNNMPYNMGRHISTKNQGWCRDIKNALSLKGGIVPLRDLRKRICKRMVDLVAKYQEKYNSDTTESEYNVKMEMEKM